MMDATAWTIARVLDWTRSFFDSKDIETARLDAELLIAHALGLSRIDLYLDHHRPLDAQELTSIRGLVRRRAQLEPIHYILGERDFWSITIGVDSRVLIPRPDTEKLVELALSNIDETTDRVLDLCTGSGAIALALATEHPQVQVAATDISKDALDVARANAERLNLSNVSFHQSDLFKGLQAQFDVIISNPPYIRSSDCKNLMADVRDYEPLMALDGGPDGLDFYRKIIQTAPRFLRSRGHLLLEIGHDQAQDLRALVEASAHLDWIKCHQDLAGNDRVVHAQHRAID
jgi:release factor glutamine methyltransferase